MTYVITTKCTKLSGPVIEPAVCNETTVDTEHFAVVGANHRRISLLGYVGWVLLFFVYFARIPFNGKGQN